MQSTPGTMSEKGAEYVAAWPSRVAQQTQLGVEHVAEALTRTGITTDAEAQTLRPALLGNEPIQVIADLTPEQGRAVVAAMRAISSAINSAAKDHCQFCGIRLNADRTCDSCGDANL
ncbi:hypothetical protein [Streptomyces qinglanensis]|uniref:hypothetical protein n=1 Tax=Streptomyces qinglanensis TaxID=943816 RepID=UPI003D73B775